MRRMTRCAALLIILALAGCGAGDSHDDGHDHDHDHHHDHGDEHDHHEDGSDDHHSEDVIDLPESVRHNLGITWAVASRGRLEMVESVPGEIVARPDRDWHVKAPMGGTLSWLASPWERVEQGQVVARLAAVGLSEVQAALYEARERAEQAKLELSLAEAGLGPERELAGVRERAARAAAEGVERLEVGLKEAKRVAEAAAQRLDEVQRLRASDAVSAAALLTARRESLEAARVVTQSMRDLNDARVHAGELALDAATTRARVDGADDRIALLKTRLAAAETAFVQRLASLAASAGTTVERLSVEEGGVPAWARMRELELRAPGAGLIVEVDVAAGSHVGGGDDLMRIVDASLVAFRALLPEADGRRFPAEFEARVSVPGAEGAFTAGEATLRAVGHAESRSVILAAALENSEGVLRPGSSATANIVTSRSANEEVLVPAECVVRDGLESIVFRRDPDDPDHVVRTVVVLGAESGGQVEIVSGVGAKDQLVREGVHQLRAAGIGKAAGGGHFHADGTFHEEDH